MRTRKRYEKRIAIKGNQIFGFRQRRQRRRIIKTKSVGQVNLSNWKKY